MRREVNNLASRFEPPVLTVNPLVMLRRRSFSTSECACLRRCAGESVLAPLGGDESEGDEVDGRVVLGADDDEAGRPASCFAHSARTSLSLKGNCGETHK